MSSASEGSVTQWLQALKGGEEIAERLGCNRRTVVRKRERIRRTWSEAFSR
jgi:DNA-binding CsgD family transcriptional regulator